MIYKHLLELADDFDIFLLDAYGVFNFGRISTSACDVMKQLMAQGKKVSIISNTTKLSSETENKYLAHGLVKGVHYIELLTSGQFAFEEVQKSELQRIDGKKMFVYGTADRKNPDKKLPSFFKNSEYKVVDNISDADFIYCAVPLSNGNDEPDIEKFTPDLKELIKSGLPMLCVNPDLKALEPSGYVVRHGAITKLYEEMGGRTVYYGKPDKNIFERALRFLDSSDKSRVLMVGDTLRTDIKGANNAGIKSCLVLEYGITAEEIQQKGLNLDEETIKSYAKQEETVVDFIIQKLPEGNLF